MTSTTATATSSADYWGSDVVETTVLGHPCLTFAKRRRSLIELLVDGRRFNDREYLVQDERRLTFADHESAVDAAASLLRERGLRRHDRVMLLGANSVDWVICYWAVLHVGGVVVLGNAWWSESELAHALATSAPRLVLADEKREPLVPPHYDSVAMRELASAPASKVAAEPEPVGEDDPAIILFTSGTTGPPKGATLSHRGTIATLHSLVVRTRRLPDDSAPLPPVSKALLSLPLFHIGGLQQVLNPMVAGGTLVFTSGRFDAEAVVELIKREQIRVWSSVPTMTGRVIDFLDTTGHRPLTEVYTLGLGGSPVGEHLRDAVLRYFPNTQRGLAVTYGLSEAGGVVTTGAGPEILKRPGTVGQPLATARIRIENPDENGQGEVLVSSPSVMLGYWRPEVPADDQEFETPITADRWLRTGDIGWMDEDGYLYITDRSKDIVIRGGENIATPHVEHRLLEHPALKEVAVVGLPHPTLGEELGAVVVLREGVSASAEELTAFAREELAYFEVPTRWWFHPGPLPQNTTGKVLKRVLSTEWTDREATVSGDLG